MKDAKDVVAGILDNGGYVEMAVKLAQTYKKVYYCTHWQTVYPKKNIARIGDGMEGIEIVNSLWGPHYDEMDLVVFPNCYDGELQSHLEMSNKAVWGSRTGEELELDRVLLKECLEEYGLPVGQYEVVKGLSALRKYLKGHKNQHVKISKYRGTTETFPAESYDICEPKLDELEHDLGSAFKEDQEFLVEEDLKDKEEFGVDTYCIDGQYPETCLWGVEVKDIGYCGKITKWGGIPEPITRVNSVLSPEFKKYGYRGALSTEVRIGKDKIPYLIDLTCRSPSPPSELYFEIYKNFADIVWYGANGIVVEPEPLAKYGAELKIISEWAEGHTQNIMFPEEYRRNVKLRNCVKKGNIYSVPPQATPMDDVGAVIGWGNSMEAAVEMAQEVADEVKGYLINIKKGSMDKAKEEIDKLNNIFPGAM